MPRYEVKRISYSFWGVNDTDTNRMICVSSGSTLTPEKDMYLVCAVLNYFESDIPERVKEVDFANVEPDDPA